MQEPSTTNDATVTVTPDTAVTLETPVAKAIMKNRKQRRFEVAVERNRMNKQKQFKHLFTSLTKWKDNQTKLTSDQVDMVFKVCLKRLFRRKYETVNEFQVMISQVERNVKKGFNYYPSADALSATNSEVVTTSVPVVSTDATEA